MSKGIRQGDPMAPFLFLIVAKGLSGLTRSAVQKNIFKDYKLSGDDRELAVSHIQYADDTIMIGDMTRSNVWAIKCILRSFELVSGLRVNFHKSGLFCSIENHALEEYRSMLNCKLGTFPFKFLGILVGANPRRSST